jgi:SAM-dependent methyltransferase
MEAGGSVSALRWAVRRTRRFVHGVGNSAIDRVLGTRTSHGVTLEELGFARGNLGRYEPSPWGPLIRSLRAVNPQRDDVLVDLGCGRGRVMLAAMSMPFQRVIGVELSPQLAAEAQGALQPRRFWMRAGAAEVVTANAAGWTLPDEVTIVYMCNPFWGSVFAGAVNNILESVERRPRRLRLIYDHPFEHNYLLSTNRFVPVQLVRAQRKAEQDLTHDVVIYEVLSSAGEPKPVGAAGAWAGTRDTSNMLPGYQPMITTPNAAH